jgi:L-ascorbate metabolism protein UlaG (beta-lactamase superfamily)
MLCSCELPSGGKDQNMQMTSLGHSAVRFTRAGVTVVVDPGCFSDPDALNGADAVLITHEHIDHVVPDQLRAAAQANADLEVWTNPAVAAQFADLGGRVHTVGHGDTFTIGDIGVHVYGAKHATIHRDMPLVDNVGFLIDGRVFHPGDALTVPEEKVTTLLAPVGAPWAKISELVDYVREVAPQEAYLIHGAVLSDAGLAVHTRLLTGLAGEPYDREIHTWTSGKAADL